ncbi:hypothetical protein [Emticicia sp. BO119]|uniref:hypothetical protein n=1 Tax=Emticicia sp. BO119 TaxID=2757768 RepID=UPI0015F015D4|nr:hypothetical protein [Emticicia sp. BO119]MBA4849477.1 hypothetical protein [Emticicia sp. BO119]
MTKTYLAVIEYSDKGIVVIESEEKSLEEIARFYQYHEAIEAELERVTKENEFLRNTLESGTIRNEQFLTSLLQIFTAIGVYDSKKNTLNLEPILKPYFEKMLADNLKNERKKSRLARKWELWRYKAGVDAKSNILNAGFKVAMFFLFKKSKAKETK